MVLHLVLTLWGWCAKLQNNVKSNWNGSPTVTVEKGLWGMEPAHSNFLCVYAQNMTGEEIISATDIKGTLKGISYSIFLILIFSELWNTVWNVETLPEVVYIKAEQIRYILLEVVLTDYSICLWNIFTCTYICIPTCMHTDICKKWLKNIANI